MSGIIKVVERATGRKFDCIAQIVDLNHDGQFTLRYVVGTQGHHGFIGFHCHYDNDRFNSLYEEDTSREANF